jgi:putative phosphoribosyl transferase
MRHGRDEAFSPRFIPMTALVTSADERPVSVPVGPLQLPGTLAWPAHPSGIVLFAHGSGSSRSSPRNIAVAAQLRSAGLATLLFDLLTPQEAEERANVFEIPVLAERLRAATEWVVGQTEMAGLVPGYFGASTGAAAALRAAAGSGVTVGAVVCRGGRPDLAGDALPAVRAPTLLIVGGRDEVVLELNRRAYRQLTGVKQLVVVAGATHLFEEPGTLEKAGRQAAGWFIEHLAMVPRWRAPHR